MKPSIKFFLLTIASAVVLTAIYIAVSESGDIDQADDLPYGDYPSVPIAPIPEK